MHPNEREAAVSDWWRSWGFWSSTFVFIALVVLIPDTEIRRWLLFGYCVILWLFHLVPLPVTGILILGLVPALGLLSIPETFALFGNEAVFFILGVFISSAALITTGLADRFCDWLVRAVSGSPRRIITLFFYGTAFLTFIMPEHASAALVLPIAIRYLERNGHQRERRWAAAVILAVTWGAVVGGIVTLLGGARSVLAIEITRLFLADSGQAFRFGFLEWTAHALPVFLGVSPMILWTLFRLGGDMRERLSPVDRDSPLGDSRPWTREEVTAASIYGLTVLVWIFWGARIGLGVIALISAVLMFAFNLLTWDDAQRLVNWGVILLFGGALVLGKVIHQSPALLSKLQAMIPFFARSPFLFLLFLALAAFILTEFISNTATVALLLPLGLELAIYMGISPKAVMLAVAVPSGLCFMLPTGTPPNAMAVASGYVPPGMMFRRGIRIALWSWAITAVWLWFTVAG